MIMPRQMASLIFVTVTAMAVAFMTPVTTAQTPAGPSPAQTGTIFQTSTQCMTCHNGVSTPAG